MDFLKQYIFFLFFITACGETYTRVDYIETDTYISSLDSTEHSDSSIIKISNSSEKEERSLLKIPTSSYTDESSLAEEILKNPFGIFLLHYYIVAEIFQSIFDCSEVTLSPSKLISSSLKLDIESSSGASLASKVKLNFLSKPWFQTANWQQAHHFTEEGYWSQEGGDVDSTAAILSTQSGQTLSFDITNYFKLMLDSKEPIHYGMMLSAVDPVLSELSLHSAQTSMLSKAPRVESTYQCNTLSSNSPKQNIYILGVQR